MSSVVTAIPVHFSRRDIKSTASATHGGLLVYPPSKKAKQRVAVGDRTGVVSVFSIGKRLDEVPVFNTMDSDKAVSGDVAQTKPPLSCAQLFTDQLFCIRGSVLDAYSRKAGDFMVTSFNEGKELGFFMSPDRIHEMLVFPIQSAIGKPEPSLRDFVACLACNDRTLRMVQENKQVDEIACEAALTALCYDETNRQLFYGTQVGSIGVFDIVGEQTLRRRCSYIAKQSQQQGQQGQTRHSSLASTAAREDKSTGVTTAGITCLALYDINCDGNLEVLAGYEDGTVQVFAMGGAPASPSNEGASCELQVIWSTDVGEKVVSIAAGAVTQGTEQPDLLVHVFSGQVIAFTLSLDDADAHNMAGAGAAETARKHQEQRDAIAGKKADTEKEIAWLQETIAAKARTLAARTGAAAKKAPLVAVASTFTANVSLKPVDQSAMLSLVVDADVPLECAIVRGTVADIAFFGTESTQVTAQHQLTDAPSSSPAVGAGAVRSGRPGSASSQGSVPSPTASSSGRGHSRRSKTKVLALATPLQRQESSSGTYGGAAAKRLEMLLWADEGHADTLTVTLYAMPAPRTAQVKSIPLCALPLYRRIRRISNHFDSQVEMQLALSTVTVVGGFSTRQVADWVSNLLPDLSDNTAAQQLQESGSAGKPLAFFSAFLGTVLSIEYGDGASATGSGGESFVSFTSDSLAALTTVKRHIVRQASIAGVTFRNKEHIMFGSAARRLELLRPLMVRCAEASKQAQLLEGLRELQSSDTDLGYLPDAHQKLLQNAEAVQAEATKQRQHESYLKRSVVALYDSLVQFREHAPRCNAKIQQELETACCGTEFSAQRLARLFFPNGEDVTERDGVLASVAASEAYANSQQQQAQQQPLKNQGHSAEALDGTASDMEALSSPSASGED